MRRRGFVSLAHASVLPARLSAAKATGAKAMTDCTVTDSATIAALRRGDKRLRIDVSAFDPPSPASAAIVVSLRLADGTRHELARFGLHPPKALSATRRPQRFLLSLQDAAAAIREGEPLCIEVGFASALGAVRGGAAQIAVQVVEAPGSNP
jgi:hypothetical protein